MRGIVFSCVTGAYDDIKPPHPGSDMDHVLFTDSINIDGWRNVSVDKRFDDVLSSKYVKILGHDYYFGGYDFTVWIDGAIEEKIPFTHELFIPILGQNDLVRIRHRKNTCIAQEVQQCIASHKDVSELMIGQVNAYFAIGYPYNNGVGLNGFMVRRNCNAIRSFSRMWWHEVRGGSHRDQISCDYCAWSCGVRRGWMEGTIQNNRYVRHNPWHG